MDGVKYLPSTSTALGKAAFTVRLFDGASFPSVALGKGFVECKHAHWALGKEAACCSDA
jgi:hypothetical protein